MLDFLELATEDLDCIKKSTEKLTEKLTENDWKYIKVDPSQFYGDVSYYSNIMNNNNNIFIPNPRIQNVNFKHCITLHHSDNRIVLDFYSHYTYNDIEIRFIVGTNTIQKPQIFVSNVEITPNTLSVYFNGLRMAEGFDYNIISENGNPNNLSVNFL